MGGQTDQNVKESTRSNYFQRVEYKLNALTKSTNQSNALHALIARKEEKILINA